MEEELERPDLQEILDLMDKDGLKLLVINLFQRVDRLEQKIRVVEKQDFFKEPITEWIIKENINKI